jgi:hypothetical protein
MNALRRDALASLTEALRKGEEAPCEANTSAKPERADTETDGSDTSADAPRRTALFYRADTFAAVNKSGFDAVFLSFDAFAALKEGDPLPDGVAIPPVLFDSEEAPVKERLLHYAERGVRYALVSSPGAISLARECGLLPVGDFRLNVTNRASADVYRAAGLSGLIAAAECTPRTADALGCALITYGRIPLMITERCFVKEHFGCDACAHASLTDRRGVICTRTDVSSSTAFPPISVTRGRENGTPSI